MTGLARRLLAAVLGLVLVLTFAGFAATPSSAQGKIRIAFGDIETVETIHMSCRAVCASGWGWRGR